MRWGGDFVYMCLLRVIRLNVVALLKEQSLWTSESLIIKWEAMELLVLETYVGK